MPICSYGGAACCAGPADMVHEHEVKVHGKRDKTGNANRGRPPEWYRDTYTKDQADKYDEGRIAKFRTRHASDRARRRER